MVTTISNKSYRIVADGHRLGIFLNDGLPKLSVRFCNTDVDDTRVKVSKDVRYETVKIISKLHVTDRENDGDTGR